MPVPDPAGKLTNIEQRLAARRSQGLRADYIPHLDLEQIRRMIAGMKERDQLLARCLFDGCLRCSEAIRIRPGDIVQAAGGWQLRILGKGGKWSAVAISATLAAQLQAYCYRHRVDPGSRIFPINRHRVYQIIDAAMAAVGIRKPDGVGRVHVLRHSGALERLRITGNPKAVQDQLRHRSAEMTMRYMKTLAHEESLEIQQQVDYQW